MEHFRQKFWAAKGGEKPDAQLARRAVLGGKTNYKL
jgi:hypothetical protein